MPLNSHQNLCGSKTFDYTDYLRDEVVQSKREYRLVDCIKWRKWFKNYLTEKLNTTLYYNS